MVSRLFGATWRKAGGQGDWPIKEKAIVELTRTEINPGVAHPLKKNSKGEPGRNKVKTISAR
jgi:hypothetical protein